MLKIAGYGLAEQIHKSARSIVYRARREGDGVPVIVKFLNDEYPSADAAARFKREYEIGRTLSGHGAVVVHGLEPVSNSWALVMEDLGARSLRSILNERRLDLAEALSIGAGVAAALAEIHALRFIHKDINPSNIVIDPETGRARIIDFGLATALPRESPGAHNPRVIEGTLRYISPEQTGRMNRAVDYRTDLYSLGVTLYEMVTGAPPFATEDAMELVHLHIAQRPTPPHEVAPSVPRAVSDVVMKLLAKSAEDRYQSALGVVADLERCLGAVQAGADLEGFVPGRGDVSDRFQIPERLYGREAEIETLVATFERAGRGRAELMLVGGQAGVGKSALIHEIHRPVLSRRGHFVAGKFDQLHRDVPYASLIQAFTDLVRQILTESEDSLARWRRRLSNALGAIGQVVVDVLPNLERIVGPQAPVPSLSPSEAQVRFHVAFQRFVRALGAEDHPLAIFLDDLQWADRPSLDLIQSLLAQPEIGHVLVVGGYRDDEVGGAHPLTLALDAIEKGGTRVTKLTVRPLGLAHVDALVADTLHTEPSRSAPLSRLVFDRTGGNPFFLGQLLRALYDDKLLDFAAGAFRWDLDAIRARGLTDDVVELMSRKIQRLPSASRSALELAACIGNRFELGPLSIVLERTPAETAEGLYPALEEGLILPVDDRWRLAQEGGAGNASYRFLHDRVQQAAYSLIDEDRREGIHHRIGRLLLAAIPEGELDDRIFDVVHQLDLGVGLVRTKEARYELARLDLRAGAKAKAAAAYEPALRYFDAGLALLPEGAWTDAYDLAFSLHVEAMVAAYVNARPERGDALSEILLERARTAIEKVQVYETRASFATMRNELSRAIEDGYTALGLLGLDLPRTVDFPAFLEVVRRADERIGERRAADLLHLPSMTDPRCLAAIRMAMTLIPPVYIGGPLPALVIALSALDLCLTHGNAPEAPFLYADYGLIKAVILGDFATGAEYGPMALELVDRLGATRVRAKVYQVVAAYITHWSVHLRKTFPLLVESVRAGMESGDLEFMAYSAAHYAMNVLFAGESLDAVLREHDRYLDLLTQRKLDYPAGVVRIMRQSALNLIFASPDPTVLSGDAYDEAAELPKLLEAKNLASVSQVYLMKTMLAVIFRRASAADFAERGEPFVIAQLGQVSAVLFNFYESLALLALAREAPEEERARLLAKVEKNQESARIWATRAPMNGEHRRDLVDAEIARTRGDYLTAAKLYDDAAAAAVKNGYLHEEALAHELAGELYQSIGRARLARGSFLDAAIAYRRWGAEAKVADLERRYPDTFAPSPTATTVKLPHSAVSMSTTTGAVGLDLATVLKAAQAISGEIVLGRLLDKLMRIMIENAGAQRGLLVLERDGHLSVEAARAVDAEPEPRLPSPLGPDAPLSEAIVRYVARTGESVVLNDAAVEGMFTADPYVARRRPRSVLAAPLLNQGKLAAVVYLENNLTTGAFTADRLEVLRLLSGQAALSIQNAVLYAALDEHNRTLEQKVEDRTHELSAKNDELALTLSQLRTTQKQLVTHEKLASLGSLTAGIAHEIKNPLNFINNFADLSQSLADELTASVLAQKDHLDPDAGADIEDAVASLRQNVVKIGEHGRRANQIIDGMLMHARDSSGAREPTDLNALLAESVHLAYHGVRGKAPELNLSVHAEYDPAVGSIEVAAPDIGRAFINVINNACYAMQEKARSLPPGFTPELRVHTHDKGDRVEVRIRDNGTGIPPTLLGKVFNPFFTTKPAGQGTGLGLSISHDIVAVAHGGEIRLESSVGEFTELTISLPKHAPKDA